MGARRQRSRGQAMTEFALVFPIMLLFLFGIIVWGLGIFYQTQVQNAAREGARYAAIHSSEAQCPTVSTHDPILYGPRPFSYFNCDTPAAGWPEMTSFARQSVWAVGFEPGQDQRVLVQLSERNQLRPAARGRYGNAVSIRAAAPTRSSTTIRPACPARPEPRRWPTIKAPTSPATRFPSTRASSGDRPLAGFLLIPSQVVMRSVVTEVVHEQQG